MSDEKERQVVFALMATLGVTSSVEAANAIGPVGWIVNTALAVAAFYFAVKYATLDEEGD